MNFRSVLLFATSAFAIYPTYSSKTITTGGGFPPYGGIGGYPTLGTPYLGSPYGGYPGLVQPINTLPLLPSAGGLYQGSLLQPGIGLPYTGNLRGGYSGYSGYVI